MAKATTDLEMRQSQSEKNSAASSTNEYRPSKGSVTHWLTDLRDGDSLAARELWHRYFGNLVRLARQKLNDVPRRVFDEEDVALSAFGSFCRAVDVGRYPDLRNRDDLWNLLMVITIHKCWNQIKHHRRKKRGGGRVHGESSLLDFDLKADDAIVEFLGDEPSPEMAAALAEEFERLLDKLRDDQLRTIAVAKMEGYTDDEIAQQNDCSRRTVVRKLKLIRTLWTSEPKG